MSILSAAFFVLSTVINYTNQRAARKRQQKAQRESAERADAAKGMTVPVEAQAAPLVVQYGRGMVGGARVYHKTFDSYTQIGLPGTHKTFINNIWGSVAGRKNEFLYVQQAACMGPVHDCVTVVVDGMVYTDPKFATAGPPDPPQEGDNSPRDGVGGLKINFCVGGNAYDPEMGVMDSTRYSARFPNVAYGTNIARLNRDDPQFGGVPTTQYIIDGMVVHTVIRSGPSYILGPRIYTNNPALCTLDYLLSPVYGKGLTPNEVNLKSFYRAAKVCDRIVLANVPINGYYWKTKHGYRPDLNIIPRGALALGSNYSIGNTVTHGGYEYQMTVQDPYDRTHFGTYVPNTTYRVGNLVTFGGVLYELYQGYEFDGDYGTNHTGEGFGESNCGDCSDCGAGLGSHDSNDGSNGDSGVA